MIFCLQGKLQFFFGVFFYQVIIKDHKWSTLHMILKSYIVAMCFCAVFQICIPYEVGSWVIHWACLKDTTCGIWNMQFWHVEILLMEEIPHHLLHMKPYETWNVLNVNWSRISSINGMTVWERNPWSTIKDGKDQCDHMIFLLEINAQNVWSK